MSKVQGMEDLHAAFSALPKATGKAALRAAGKDALEPMRAAAAAGAPEDTGQLEKRVIISPKSRSGKARGRKAEGPQAITLYMGPDRKVTIRGQMQEFGTFKEPAQPFMRPAWDAHADSALESIGANLWDRMNKATERQQRKAARLAAKGKL